MHEQPIPEAADETIVQLVLADLIDSPSQPRDSLPNIPELAANIKAEGRIHQPLLVRPLPDGRRQIVYGHRRKYGGIEAGLVTGPCIVRAMTDAQVRSAQMTENIQREAMKAMEEAKGFRAMMDADGLSVRTLAERIGKSASFVGGRVRLLSLCAEVRTALLAGKIEAEVALYIARTGGEKMQKKALGYIDGKYWDLEDGGKKSVRQIHDLLRERFTLQLDKAVFDPFDEMLLPLAGHCMRCPKRSGNAPEFADIAGDDVQPEDGAGGRYRDISKAGADVCTDPDCFHDKKKAHLKREADKLQAAGKTVIDGNKARAAIDAQGNVKGAYIAVKDIKAELKAVAGKKPEIITIQDPRNGRTHQAYKVEDLQAAGVKGVARKPAANTPAHYEAERKKREEEHRRDEAKAKAENSVRMAMLAKVREAIAASPRTAFDLRLIAPMVFAAVGWHERPLLAEVCGFKDRVELERKIGQLDTQALTLFMIDCALVYDLAAPIHNLRGKPETLLLAAKEYGVDLDAVRREIERPAANPPPAAPAKERAKADAKNAKSGPAAKYRDPMTLQTWSGRGLMPAWLRAAIAGGKGLADFEAGTAEASTPPPAAQAKTKRKPSVSLGALVRTGQAIQKQMDEAGCAGEERDTKTADLFEGARP